MVQNHHPQPKGEAMRAPRPVHGKAIPAVLAMLAALLLTLSPGPAPAAPPARGGLSTGQTIYLPFYSRVIYDQKGNSMDVAASWSIRNPDPDHAVIVHSVTLYNGEGRLLAEYLAAPQTLPPMSAIKQPVRERSSSLPGAPCLVIRWSSDKPVNPPLAQCVMIGASGQQGISFITEGFPLAGARP